MFFADRFFLIFMKKVLNFSTFVLCFIISLFLFSQISFAGFTDIQISFSEPEPLVGQSIRMYANITNRSKQDIRGIVKFYDGNYQLGGDQPFSIRVGKNADVFIDYKNLPYGDRTIRVSLSLWDAPNEKESSATSLFVDQDTDGDGVPNRKDEDDDNDGVADNADAFPLDATESKDSDRDGIGDNKDPDDDNDGLSDVDEKVKGTDPFIADTDKDQVNDLLDAFPLDPTESVDTDQDGIGNNKDEDDDNDGVPDTEDELPLDASDFKDSDGDGIGDERDPDDDNDGLLDGQEKDAKTDTFNPDTDNDGVKDGQDAFPLDPKESKDSDGDGVGDNADPNDENAGPVFIVNIPEKSSIFSRIFVDGSKIYDPDGGTVKVSWNIGGKTLEEPSPSFRYFLPGKHIIKLIATDDEGETREQVYIISISLNIWGYLILGVMVFLGITWGVKKYYLKKE